MSALEEFCLSRAIQMFALLLLLLFPHPSEKPRVVHPPNVIKILRLLFSHADDVPRSTTMEKH